MRLLTGGTPMALVLVFMTFACGGKTLALGPPADAGRQAAACFRRVRARPGPAQRRRREAHRRASVWGKGSPTLATRCPTPLPAEARANPPASALRAAPGPPASAKPA